MKIPYAAPPQSLRSTLGPEGFDYLERMHGMIQGLGHRDDELGNLDARNLGIKTAKPGDLLAIDEDGSRAKVVDPYVENLRSQSAGFLQADSEGRINASPVDIEGTVQNIVRQEFAAASVNDGEITPGGITVGSTTETTDDGRRYALLMA